MSCGLRLSSNLFVSRDNETYPIDSKSWLKLFKRLIINHKMLKQTKHERLIHKQTISYHIPLMGDNFFEHRTRYEKCQPRFWQSSVCIVSGSSRVSDNALRRACYTLRFLFAGHSRVRNSFYRLSGRVALIGRTEGTNWIPEHSNLPAWWNDRARGLGATTHAPVSTGGEENVLCLK